MKKQISIEEYYHLINHGPCCLVTSGNETVRNVAPISWITPVNDDPPIVGISVATTTYTAELIEKYKEFVINIPSVELLDVVLKSGSVSGRKKDKFSLCKLTAVKGVKVSCVHIDECLGFIEAKLVDVKEYDGVKLFIGKVVHCEVEEKFYDKYLLPEKAKTIHHIGGKKFIVSGKIIGKS